MKIRFSYFSKLELALWTSSVAVIIAAFLLFDGENYPAMAASLIGVTSLIFCAKGNPIGQALMIVFALLYGAISFSFAYYGEMLTYIGMTLPMAVIALVSWLRNPYEGARSEVRVRSLGRRELCVILLLTATVTLAFYFILKYFNTANLLPSTVSVATSFFAMCLTFRRSPFYALAYMANDIVLIVLWVLASMADTKYVSVAVCFVAFLFNDVYGFISWQRMKKRQALRQ